MRVWIVDYSRSAYDTILHINHYAELRLHDLAGWQTRGDFSSSNRVYQLCRFFYPLFAWYKATLLTHPVPGCQVCTIVGPNEDNCSPLPSSLSCTPQKSSTVLTADTSGVTVGTLTGSALYSAITSGLDQVCQVPPNNGATSAYTCTETATATLAPDVIYYDTGVGEAQFKFDGSLTLQVTEANYDSLEWYATNKAILAAMAQNSTQSETFPISVVFAHETISARSGTYTVCQTIAKVTTEFGRRMNLKRGGRSAFARSAQTSS